MEKIKNWTIIGLMILVVCLVLLNQCTRDKYHDADHNYAVMTDSMRVMETKYNGLVYANNSLILSKNELQERLDISKKEYKELERKLESTIAYYSNLSGKVEYDTIVMVDTMWVEDGIQYVRFSYTDKWAVIDGVTRLEPKPKTTINILSISTPLHVGITSDYQIFVTCDNPYVHFTDMEGAVIDKSKLKPKEKRFGIGLHTGFGVQYNIINKSIGMGPEVGFGLNYKLF